MATLGSDPDRARKVEVVAYDAAWPRLFAAEEAKIRGALGAAALLIEHVGSTAVPGLAAKPVIDVQLAVRDSTDEAAYRSALERAGYRLIIREPEWFEHRLFKGAAPETNLHVFQRAAPNSIAAACSATGCASLRKTSHSTRAPSRSSRHRRGLTSRTTQTRSRA